MHQNTDDKFQSKITLSAISMLSVGVVIAASIAWLNGSNWQIAHLSIYQIFPIFGMVAFSLMWSQYVANCAERFLNLPPPTLKTYFEITSVFVLIAILLHPGLLAWQLWHDGFGLPPESYLRHYVAPNLAWAALLGTVSLLVFLAYELRRIFQKYRWWRFMVYVTDAAMIAIFFHALALGSQVQSGWFRILWFFYGFSLVAILIYLRLYLPSKKSTSR